MDLELGAAELSEFPRKIQEKRFKVRPEQERPDNPLRKAIDREIGEEEDAELPEN